MKAKAVTTITGVTLEMTLREAEILKALVGGIGLGGVGVVDDMLSETFYALKAAGVGAGDDKTESFSDFFVVSGEYIHCKSVKT